MARMALDNKLGTNRFYIDGKHPHITIDNSYKGETKIIQLTMACPAGLYQYEDMKIIFNHEGCLECGTCRVLSNGKVVKTWSYPTGGKGIEFMQG